MCSHFTTILQAMCIARDSKGCKRSSPCKDALYLQHLALAYMLAFPSTLPCLHYEGIPAECKDQGGCIFCSTDPYRKGRRSLAQVGVHGAGLINAFFMRPGSSMVEIFPCRFPADWASQYFWRPALVEKIIMPFQIHMQDEARCRPSELERNPAGDATISTPQ